MFTFFTALSRQRAVSCAHVIAVAVFSVASVHAFAQQTSGTSATQLSDVAPMTLQAALQSAADKSSITQAAQASVQASSEAAVRAGQLPDPTLKAGIDNLPVTGQQAYTIGQDFMTMRRIGIEQEWVSGEKRTLRSELAGQVVSRERDSYLAQFVNVREQTAAAWLDATYAKQAISLQSALLDHMEHELDATKASYRGAKAKASDVVDAQTMLAQTQDQVLKARQTYQTALIALSRWTATPVFDVSGDPPAPESMIGQLPPDELRRVHPTLLEAADDIAVADADTAVANSERTPNWTWEVAYQQRGGQFSNMVSIGVSIPLPINRKDRQDRTVAEKGALATKARLMLEDEQRRVEADVRALSVTLASGRERIDSLVKSLLPAANQRVELANAAYKAGTGSLADTFAARRAQLDAELQVLALKRDVSQTWAQLEYQVVPPAMGEMH